MKCLKILLLDTLTFFPFFTYSCFLSNTIVFWLTFLGPILIVVLINTVIFIRVIILLVKHKREMLALKNESMETKEVVRLMISLAGIMFLFGLSWIFAAFTITIEEVRIPAQVLFAIFNSLQGFFIFLFFCVFNKDARESWKEVQSCGKYKSDYLNPFTKWSKNPLYLHKELSRNQFTSLSSPSYYQSKTTVTSTDIISNKGLVSNGLDATVLSGENRGENSSKDNSGSAQPRREVNEGNLSSISSDDNDGNSASQE